MPNAQMETVLLLGAQLQLSYITRHANLSSAAHGKLYLFTAKGILYFVYGNDDWDLSQSRAGVTTTGVDKAKAVNTIDKTHGSSTLVHLPE